MGSVTQYNLTAPLLAALLSETLALFVLIDKYISL